MNRIKTILKSGFFLLLVSNPIFGYSQEADDAAIRVSNDTSSGTLNNMFALLEQAGGIRYAIYLVLAFGVFLLCLKAYDLFSDSIKSKHMFGKSFRYMEIQDIIKVVASEKDHMLSRISAVQLNVYQSSKSAEYLHDEISNYNRFHQDNFTIYRSRIDFLSDTAGALGLLGTVWGMFMVFSTGNLEKEQILAGMGVALLTTLLGLIVSIILNFFTTVIQSYFSKYLEKVVDKADELRFRLMELNELGSHPANNLDNQQNGRSIQAEIQKPHSTVSEKTIKREPKLETFLPRHLLIENNNQGGNAGEMLSKPIKSVLLDQNKKPIRGTKLHFKVTEGDGKFSNENDFFEMATDENGRVEVMFKLGNKPGLNSVEVSVPGQSLKSKYLFIGQEESVV
jgi:biopolymer transport protein ExbB/TolQ